MDIEAIMDLSSYGKTREFREKLINISPAMIGSVPMYDAVGFLDKDLKDISEVEFLNVIKQHAIDGVDFITIHTGLIRGVCKKIKDNNRLTNIVSREGSLLFAWMELNDRENPLYTNFDNILDICEEYDVTLSFGDACRPGCIKDSTDSVQIDDLIVLGEFTKKAWKRNVQVMIEGPGHMAIDEIEKYLVSKGVDSLTVYKEVYDEEVFYTLLHGKYLKKYYPQIELSYSVP